MTIDSLIYRAARDRRRSPRSTGARRAGPLDRYGERLTVRSREHGSVCRPRLIATREGRIVAFFAGDVVPPTGEELDALFIGSGDLVRVRVGQVEGSPAGGSIVSLVLAENRRRRDRRSAAGRERRQRGD